MKSTVLFLIVAYLLMSCTNPLSDKSIVGTWQVIDFESNTDISPIIMATAKEIAKSQVYQINQGYKIGWKDTTNPDGYSGHWQLDTIQKQIRFNFEDSQGELELTYEIIEFNGDQMKWIVDMGKLGQNIITLERCDSCAFEIPPAFRVGESDLEKLEELALSSVNYTDAYCTCMEELKKRESCIEAYDKARFEIKALADLTTEKFKIRTRIGPSDNEYVVLVKELRDKLVYCRNGLDDNTYNSDLFKSSSPPK